MQAKRRKRTQDRKLDSALAAHHTLGKFFVSDVFFSFDSGGRSEVLIIWGFHAIWHTTNMLLKM